MASWKFNIYKKDESAEIKEKMKKLKKSRHNPKNIPIFENIFETESAPILSASGFNPPKSRGVSALAGGKIIEGLTGKEAEESTSANKTSMGIETVDLTDKFQDAFIINNDNYSSLSDLYNKIAEKNKSTKKQSGKDTLNALNSMGSKSGKADIFNAGNSGFWLPKSDISDLPKHKVTNDKSSMDAAELLGSAQTKVNLLSNQTSASMTTESAALSSEIAALKSKIDSKKLIDPDAPIPSQSSPAAKAQTRVQIKGLGDQLKVAMKKAADEISYVLTTSMKFLGEEIKYGGKIFLSVLMHFRDSYNYFVIVMSNGLTNNNATLSEVKIFSSEILKFTTVLFTYIFVYNWYYYLFYLGGEDAEVERFKLNFSSWMDSESENYRPILYTFFGPSLSPTELLDTALIKIASYIQSFPKPILFFLLAICFFCLVLGNLQMIIFSSFLKALSFNSSASSISIIMSVLTMGFAIYWIYKSKIWQSAASLSSIISCGFSILGCLIGSVLYLLYIMFVGVPFGILSINSYIMIYSFFAILIYSYANGAGILKNVEGGISGTIKKIYTQVSPTTEELQNTNESEQEQEADDGEAQGFAGKTWNFLKKSGAWIMKFIEKYAKYVNMYLVELLIIMILLAGINTYTSQYGAVQFDKTDSQSVNNIGSPVSNAFKHLFTWLIIINTIIILFVGVRMWGKYYKLKEGNAAEE